MSMQGESANTRHIKLWIRSQLTGCIFASRLLSANKIWALEFSARTAEGVDIGDINDKIEFAGSEQVFVVAIFPSLNSLTEAKLLLDRLGAGQRWRVATRTRDSIEYVKVEWLTAQGKWSNCMGLAPFISMPPTRRAPFVGLALWPGDASRDPESETVDFHDIPNPIEREKRKPVFEKVQETVENLMEGQPEREWRSISFAFASDILTSNQR